MNTEATLAAEPEATETQEAEVKATETAEAQPEPAQETEVDREAKKAAKLEARFARLTREKYELKARLDAMERYAPQQTQPQAEDGEQDIEAIIDRKVQEREQQKQAQSFVEKSQSILEKAAEIGEFDLDDFIPLPRGAADYLVELDNPKLVAHLQNNPEIIDRISKLSDRMQVAEIAKLEVKLSSPAIAKKSGAPAPIKPIGGNQAKLGGYRENMTQAEYEEWRNSTQKRR